jgi:predicted RNA methylase
VKIPPDVLDVLAAAATDGEHLVLTGPRMEAKLYKRVNEVLEAVGGRWTTAVSAHVFPGDAAEAIAPLVATGQVVTLREKRNDAQYFPTPAAVVQRLLELAELNPGMEVLEPSAGSGAVATAVAAQGVVVDCFERDPGYAGVLVDTGAARTVRVVDFLDVIPEVRFDRVVMNPPFTKGADVAHVQHALRFLKPDGLLVSVMPWSVTYQGGATAKFRALVEQRGGTVEAVPDGAFAESGTDVATVLVTIPATARADAPPIVWPTRQVTEREPDEAEHRSPLEILADIKQSIQEAAAIFDDLEQMLREPYTRAEVQPADAIELPAPRRPEQLAFDALGEAS